ncbi:hypothetical protein Cob_v000684 [Colletotrichum orbiculare MAFF 240422]|uniref:Uncharacterized protein n=1 Tax=Colletotrichum orbiculare (strain 104-T / ATCC 96160 / CBS 514.97 / LARS 414 / MAFF 240422) TaxID=1213857 RepID=A0A484GA54_COLOR|nr:hypothetical protein Cob_v000684 [Colletotrichum orbiculare MAFF 240422]
MRQHQHQQSIVDGKHTPVRLSSSLLPQFPPRLLEKGSAIWALRRSELYATSETKRPPQRSDYQFFSGTRVLSLFIDRPSRV